MENVAMAKKLDWPGLVDEIEISESARITVEQIEKAGFATPLPTPATGNGMLS